MALNKLTAEELVNRRPPTIMGEAAAELCSVRQFLFDLHTDEGTAMAIRLGRGIDFLIREAREIPESPVHWDPNDRGPA